MRRNRELASLPKAGGDLRAVASAASRRAAIEQQALGELRKLTPPANEARAYRSVLAGDEAALRQVRKLAAAAQANDAGAVAAASKATGRGQLRLLVATARAGLHHCYA